MSLAKFISCLDAAGMMDSTKIKANGDAGFESRLKVQTYVCLAQSFGLDLKYKYSLRPHGPYSHRLAEDCQNLDGMSDGSPPSGLRHDEFISALKGRDTDWLETAATITHEKRRNPGVLPGRFDALVPDYTPEFVRSVYDDLGNLGLFKDQARN